MVNKYLLWFLPYLVLTVSAAAQDLAYQGDASAVSYRFARSLAHGGEHRAAKDTLQHILKKYPGNLQVISLLARTHSWDGEYELARKEFNKFTSRDRNSKEVWLAAIKNELYAANHATALGLANKALSYLGDDPDVDRLRQQSIENINQAVPAGEVKKEPMAEAVREKEAKAVNTLGITNAVRMFDMIYEPMIYSSIDYKRQTRFGSIIPRINYSNRFNTHGIQYDIDLYPKFSKRFYAYINYGYSSSDIYPNHKIGGDLYANLPGAMEASGGMRYISFDTRDIMVVTNSFGLYKGNYYFSLRSYITPKSNNLTRISGNLLVRKYLKDAENYLGISAGMGFSPEFRQITLDGMVLAETLLYLESQRLNMEYQFTGKGGPSVYKTRLGLARQELASSPGNYFWSLLGGLTYKVKF